MFQMYIYTLSVTKSKVTVNRTKVLEKDERILQNVYKKQKTNNLRMNFIVRFFPNHKKRKTDTREITVNKWKEDKQRLVANVKQKFSFELWWKLKTAHLKCAQLMQSIKHTTLI